MFYQELSSKSSDIAYRGVSDEKVISYDLYLLPNLTGHFGVGGPVILIERIFDRHDRVLRNEGFVHIFQAVTRDLVGTVIVLFSKVI